MDPKKRGLIIVIAAIILLALIAVVYYYSKYNQFKRAGIEIKSAWAQVENQLQRRYDLIPNLVETVKGYAKQEREVLIEVTKARARVGGAGSVPEKIAANNDLSSALSRLLVVIEKYPELKSNENFLRLQDELAGTENRIAVERMRYNQKVEAYNKAIAVVPGSIIAKREGFKEEPFFEAVKEAQTGPPQVKF
ncbi:MAG TPA: LemA family protein [Smithellaceae bacterium]|nr:LemA family protein [Smithellaceae bacterium]HRS88457.1 LemA family protein [Smithellaceae bacterium]HRV25513.1 LemA family protein [Smithellaceae bacterium]